MYHNKIIFFHVPKCGGTSVEHSFSDFFGLENIKYPATILDYLVTPPDDLLKFKILAGHITHDAALPFINEDTALITLFRSPMQRIRSLYNYYSKLNDDSVHFNLARSLSFNDWIYSNHPEVLVNIQNAVIRQFTPESYWDVNRSANADLIFSYAKKFLRQFHIIGFLDNYDDFILSLNNLFDIKLSCNSILNKSSEDLTLSMSDDDLYNWMFLNSQLDLEFFRFAKTLV